VPGDGSTDRKEPPVIDDHGHPIALEGGPLDVSALTLDLTPDERNQRRAQLGPSRVFHELLTTKLAVRLGCDPDELASARADASKDWPAYVRDLFADAGITGVVMDVAYPPDSFDRLETFEAITGCSIHPLFRIDYLVDGLIDQGATAREIVDAVTGAQGEASSKGHVGCKTIIAYRTGLAVDPTVSEREADASLAETEVPVRRRGKPLRDLVLTRALEAAADLDMPFQIHTGFGDSDIRLAESNPLLLEELLRSPAGSAGRIDLIHGGFPWHEEIAFLAATKPNVWVDVSLFDIFSPATLADRLLRLVDVAPVRRLLMGTDGFHEPELYWFGAKVLGEAWAIVRGRLRDAGARDSWLDDAERRMFEGNAGELYGI
jgi:uncharacterized protein